MIGWLPRLNENATIQGFGEPGRWETRGFGEITRLADSLAAEVADGAAARAADAEEGEQAPILRAAAIPTPWAWAFQNARILQSPGHPDHDGAVAEWRGLLALVTLQKWRSANVELVSLDGGDSRTPPPRFAAAMRQLLPPEWGDRRQSWKQVKIIRSNGQPVGMTVPRALLCPAVVKPGAPADSVPWMKGGRLSDPVAFLSRLEREVLFDRVIGLRQALDADGRPNLTDRIRTAVVRMLDRFAKDLLPSGTPRRTEAMAQPGTIGDCLRTAIPIPEVPFQSDLWLAAGRAGAKRVIVLPEAGAVGGLGDAIVWKTITVDQLVRLREHGKQHQLRDALDGSGRTIWSADDIFESKLIVLTGADSLPGGLQIQGSETYQIRGSPAKMLVPLKASILEHFTPAELYSQLKVEREGESVKFTLNLSVEDDNGRSAGQINLTKHYTNDDTTVIQDVPVLEIWPNVKRLGWRLYYSILRGNRNSVLAAEPIFAGTSNDQTRRFDEKNQLTEIRLMQEYPEAFLFVTPSCRGLLLLSTPDEVPLRELEWTVGVDFGTSGTLAGVRIGEGGPKAPIGLPSRLRMITLGNDVARVDAMFNYFVPTIDIPVRTSNEDTTDNYSILSAFMEPAANEEGAKIEPLKDGHIYFVQSLAKFRPQDDGVSIDLKWGSDRERDRSEAFLHQFCLHICAEAALAGVRSIDWRYSYPNSFSAKDRGSFLNIWTKIVAECRRRTGIASRGPESYSEGVAAAKSFVAAGGLLLRGALCVDIGGGTTDITLWQGDVDKVKLQSSVRFAGRDILSVPLRAAPNILAQLNAAFRNELAAAIESRSKPKAFMATIDATLQQKGDLLLEYGAKLSDNEALESIIDIIKIGYSGLFYYMGMMTDYAVVTNKYEPRTPNIYIAGNGSKLLHWACDGAFAPNAPFVQSLKKIFYAAAFPGQEPSPAALAGFEIRLSNAPKQEVVLGLVEEAAWLRAQDTIESIILAGETFSYSEDTVEEDRTFTSLTKEDLERGIRSSRRLYKFSEFLSLTGQAINLEEAGRIADRIDQHCSVIRGEILYEGKDLLPEPIFLLALKFYILDKLTKRDLEVPAQSAKGR